MADERPCPGCGAPMTGPFRNCQACFEQEHLPIIDPGTRPWDDPEMAFAMMSVVIAARLHVLSPSDTSADLLANAVRLCDHKLARWNERQ